MTEMDVLMGGHSIDGFALSSVYLLALEGDTDAQGVLGYSYYFGHGVGIDYSRAFYWLQKSCARGSDGNFYACLGMCYHYGHGTEQSYEKAIKWFRRAGVRGNSRAQGFCGYMYWGGEGVDVDHVEGYAWMLVSASQGEEIAEKEVANMKRFLTDSQISRGTMIALHIMQKVIWAQNIHLETLWESLMKKKLRL